jgi:ribonuclease BN (tRNA processing enzyme)
LKYGGDTTCIEIRTQSGDIIIVDAGTGIRRLGNLLVDEGLRRCHFILTHAHWDHLIGFPFFKPLHERGVEIQMHKCPFTAEFVERALQRVMSAPYFPVPYSRIQADLVYQDGCPEVFTVGSVTVDPIPLSHPNGGSGYKFTEGDRSFVFLTDNELGYIHGYGLRRAQYVDAVRGAELLIHDGEYTPDEYRSVRRWGHSTYTDALELALDAEVAALGFFHLNQERTDRQMDALVDDAHRRIAERRQQLRCFAVGSDMTFEV